MGFTTGNTNSFNVYLTPQAREKLFTGNGGELNIEYFSLHDSDINYTKSGKTATLSGSPAGMLNDVPDLRGVNGTIGVNGCRIQQLEDFIIRDSGGLTPCPSGLSRGINGECVDNRFLRQRSRQLVRNKINNSN
tara:strand:- start:1881 stop:2282 length:402 start_codon:yes stop_codon:yes gene_type:complete